MNQERTDKNDSDNQHRKDEEKDSVDDNPNRNLCLKNLSLPPELIEGNRSHFQPINEKKFQWSKRRCLFYILSEIIFFVNFITDIAVGVEYISYGNTMWGWIIIITVLTCLLFQQIFSFCWSIKCGSMDGDNTNNVDKALQDQRTSIHHLKANCKTVLKYIICLSRLQRYIRLIRRGRKEHNRREHTLIIFDLLEAAILDVIEAAVASAPQLVLQLYFMIESSQINALRVISVCISAIEISFTIAHHAKILRESESQLRPTANTLTRIGYFVYTMWRFCTLSSRMIFLSLCAYSIGSYIFMILGIHWIIVVILSIWDAAGDYFLSSVKRYIFCILLGYIDIFFFLNVKQGRTRMRYLVHFFLLFLEMTGVVVYWLLSNKISLPLVLPVLVGALICYVIGVIFMIVYYCCAHPTKEPISTYLLQPHPLPKSATRQSLQLYYSQANSRNVTPGTQRRGNIISQVGSRRHSLGDNINGLDPSPNHLKVFNRSLSTAAALPKRKHENDQFLHPNKATVIFADQLAKLNAVTIEEESTQEQTTSITVSDDGYPKPICLQKTSHTEVCVTEFSSTNSRSSHEDDDVASDSGIAVSSGSNRCSDPEGKGNRYHNIQGIIPSVEINSKNVNTDNSTATNTSTLPDQASLPPTLKSRHTVI